MDDVNWGLYTLEDLGERYAAELRTEGRQTYDTIRTSGILRQLLLEPEPRNALCAEALKSDQEARVARPNRLRLRFPIASSPDPQWVPRGWPGSSPPTPAPGTKITVVEAREVAATGPEQLVSHVTLDEFLALSILDAGRMYNVREVVKILANGHGGVHRAELREEGLISLDDLSRFPVVAHRSRYGFGPVSGLAPLLFLADEILKVTLDAFDTIEDRLRERRGFPPLPRYQRPDPYE